MLVKNWMRNNVVTVDVNVSMKDAIKISKKHNIRMLPVMEKNKLVGIVTDRDLRSASIPDVVTFEIQKLLDLIAETEVKDIMTKNPMTIPFDYTVEEAAKVLLTNKISGLPVVDHEGQLVGTITQSDLCSVLMSVTGMGKRGIQFAFMEKRGMQFAFQVEDRIECMKELEEILRKQGGRMTSITSIMSCHERCPEGYRKVYIRMYGIDRAKLPELKKDLSEKASLLYIIDHRHNKREIYI